MRFSKFLAALACAALCLPTVHAAGAKPKKRAAAAESAVDEASEPFNERNKSLFTFMILARMVHRLQDECRVRHPDHQESVAQAYRDSIFGKTSIHIDVRINDATIVDVGSMDRWVESMMGEKAFDLESPQFGQACADFSSAITALLAAVPQSTLDEIAAMKK